MRLLGWIGANSDLLVATIEGQEITTTKPGNVDLRIISKNGSPQPTFAILRSAFLNTMQLSRDGKLVAFVAREDSKDNIWVVSTKGGEPRKLTSNMDSRLYYSNLAFSADGQTIYFGKQSSSTLISMIDNFR